MALIYNFEPFFIYLNYHLEDVHIVISTILKSLNQCQTMVSYLMQYCMFNKLIIIG